MPKAHSVSRSPSVPTIVAEERPPAYNPQTRGQLADGELTSTFTTHVGGGVTPLEQAEGQHVLETLAQATAAPAAAATAAATVGGGAVSSSSGGAGVAASTSTPAPASSGGGTVSSGSLSYPSEGIPPTARSGAAPSQPLAEMAPRQVRPHMLPAASQLTWRHVLIGGAVVLGVGFALWWFFFREED